MSGAEPDNASQRIDKWLWFARLTKTRSLAARLCAGGQVAVSGAPASKAHRAIRIGDLIQVPQGRFMLTVRVRALGTRRGPAAEARLLYEEEAPRAPLRADRPDWMPLLGAADE